MEENNITTIKISRHTRERLGAIGNKEDTFDDIVIRLLDLYEEYRMNQIIEEKSR